MTICPLPVTSKAAGVSGECNSKHFLSKRAPIVSSDHVPGRIARVPLLDLTPRVFFSGLLAFGSESQSLNLIRALSPRDPDIVNSTSIADIASFSLSVRSA